MKVSELANLLLHTLNPNAEVCIQAVFLPCPRVEEPPQNLTFRERMLEKASREKREREEKTVRDLIALDYGESKARDAAHRFASQLTDLVGLPVGPHGSPLRVGVTEPANISRESHLEVFLSSAHSDCLCSLVWVMAAKTTLLTVHYPSWGNGKAYMDDCMTIFKEVEESECRRELEYAIEDAIYLP